MVSASAQLVQAQTPGLAQFRQGEALRKAGKCAEAIEQYNTAIAANATEYRYYFAKGVCEVKLQQFELALLTFRKVAELKPDYGNAYIYIAKLELRKQNYNGAIVALNQAYANERETGKKLQYKGLVVSLLLRANKPQDAMNEVRQMKELAPDDPKVLAAEGDVFSALNNWEASIRSYTQAIAKLEATSQDINTTGKYYYKLAVAYHKSGQVEKADQTAQKLVATPYKKRYDNLKQQTSAKYYVAIAMGYYRANVFGKALEYANKAVQAEPTNPLGYRVLGIVQLKNDQAVQGIASLGQAANNEKDPAKKSAIYSQMIKVQFNERDYNGALRTANEILAKSPENASVWGLKAQAEYNLNKFVDAVNSAEKAIQYSPKDPKKTAAFYFTQGLAANKAGNYEKAREAFKNAQQGSSYRLAARIELNSISAK